MCWPTSKTVSTNYPNRFLMIDAKQLFNALQKQVKRLEDDMRGRLGTHHLSQGGESHGYQRETTGRGHRRPRLHPPARNPG